MLRRKISSSANLNAAAAAAAAAIAPAAPWVWEDVPYFSGPTSCPEKHALDIYVPSSPFPRPLARSVLFVHGGAWRRGDRKHSQGMQLYGRVGKAIAGEGMLGCVMSYRQRKASADDQALDVVRALNWMHRHIQSFGGDPHDLAVVGHSSGAHVAALALSRPLRVLVSVKGEKGEEKSCRWEEVSASVKSFVGISGVYDVPALSKRLPIGMGRKVVEEVFGKDVETWKESSPADIIFAAGRDSPLASINVLLMSAEKDFHLADDANKLMGAIRMMDEDRERNHRESYSVARENINVDGDHASTVMGFNSRPGSAGFQSASKVLNFLKTVPSDE